MTAAGPARARVVALVGGGPRATYVLAALASRVRSGGRVLLAELHVYEATGRFGSGWVHAPDQPRTSVLNRVASEVCFGAAVEPYATLADVPAPQDRSGGWLPRARHGAALAEAFENHVEVLRGAGVVVELHHALVRDVRRSPQGRLVVGAGPLDDVVERSADHVLLLTGHDTGHADLRLRVSDPAASPPYPLERALARDRVPAGSHVLIDGTGLTAIDQVMALTVGRGGSVFVERGQRRPYRASSAEPQTLTLRSPSGLVPLARPYDLASGAPDASPLFLDERTVRALARRRGRLDFAADIWPLLLGECAQHYYRNVLGPGRWSAVLTRWAVDHDVRPSLDPWGAVEAAATDSGAGEHPRLGDDPLFRAYVLAEPTSLSPLELLELNLASAEAGIAGDPTRRAMEYAFRTLRGTVQALVDDFGLAPESDLVFRRDHARRISRVVNGAAWSTVAVVVALARDGRLRVVVGSEDGTDPDASGTAPGRDVIRLPGRIEAGRIEARDSLVGHLVRTGLLSRRVRRTTNGSYTHPGVWVSERFLAVGADGVETSDLTVLGPALEGQKSFQFSAARPVAGHDVLSGVERALGPVLGEAAHTGPGATCGTSPPRERCATEVGA